MRSFLKNYKGSGLIGLLVAIVIIAALAYGSSFFWPKNSEKKVSNLEEKVDILNQAKKDIEEINKNTEEKKETADEILNNKQIVEISDDLDKWQTLQRENEKLLVKYPNGWYYDRDEEAEKKLDYKFYIGFGESPEVLEKGAPYPVELIIVDKSYQFPDFYSGTLEIVREEEGKKYILKIDDELKYRKVLNIKAKSFEYIN